jgi:hypothetical protein
VFAPHGAHLFVSGKFAAGGGGLRICNGRAFFRRESHRRRLIVCSGEPENNASDVVLSLRRETARGLKCSVEKFCHRLIVNPLFRKTTKK